MFDVIATICNSVLFIINQMVRAVLVIAGMLVVIFTILMNICYTTVSTIFSIIRTVFKIAFTIGGTVCSIPLLLFVFFNRKYEEKKTGVYRKNNTNSKAITIDI